MVLLRQFLIESKMIEIYHGDNFSTTRLDPSLMNNGRNQEGIGIYFSNSISTAKSYGKNVVKISINPSKFVDSRGYVGDIIGKAKIKKLLSFFLEKDREQMFFYLSDWFELQTEKDVKLKHIDVMVNNVVDEEMRNFQIDMANRFGVELFVEAWNSIVKIDGLFNKVSDSETWYTVINTSMKVEKHLI